MSTAESPTKKPVRKGLSLHVYLPPDLRRALQRYVDSTEPKSDATAVTALALRRFLESVGFWPPPPP